MNRLPAHRQAINGRTHSTCWRPEDFDPIERPPRRWRVSFADVLLAALIGVVLAAALVEWWMR